MAIKTQALTDFIAEFTHNVTSERKVGTSEEQDQDEDLTRWKLFIDGSSNQHGCGMGLILQTISGEQMEYTIRIGFKATTNKAEYEALLAGLRIATKLGVESSKPIVILSSW